MLQSFFHLKRSSRSARSARKTRRGLGLFLERLEDRLAPASFNATEGTPFSGIVASVTDPDPTAPLSAFTASINWGDSTSSTTGTISQPGGAGTDLVVSGGHTYADEGSFQVRTTISEGGATVSNLDFSNGFAGSSSLLTYNGTATIVGSVAQLTNVATGGVGSFFSTNKVAVNQFNTVFSFQLLSAVSDGITFCIQGSANSAFDPKGGGGLGFGWDSTGGPAGIPNSVAVKFDLYSNQGEGPDSTGLYTNGVAPTIPAIDLRGTGIDLHGGDVFNASMTYDGATLNVTITDANTGASASQSYTIDIPGTVGGNTAYVGFTGACGGGKATQNIRTWTYKSGVTAIATSTAIVADADVLTATGGYSWTATEGGTPIGGTVATFTDAYPSASASDFIATIDWGDGTISTGTVTGSAGSFTVTASHTFADEGSLPVIVTIKDDGAGTAMAVAQDSATISENDVLTPVTISKGLVGLWKAEGNANDSIGSNNGTLKGNATFASGRFGQAFSFNGTSAYVSVPYSSSLALNTFTVEAWVNVATTPNVFGILGTRFGGDYTFDFKVQSNIHGDVGNGTSWISEAVDYPATLKPGIWHLITYVIDNDSKLFSLYLDGVLQNTIPFRGTPIFMTPGETLEIGNSFRQEYFNGLIDEVAIFNRALQPAEIQATMNDNFTGPTTAPSFKASEGQQFSGIVAGFADTNTSALSSDFAVTINWGDGTTSQGTASGSGGSYAVNGSHTYAEEGTYSYSVQIQDDPPGTASLTIPGGTAMVADAPLALSTTSTINAVEGVAYANPVASFTDGDVNGTASDYTATIDWGDGSTSTGTLAPSANAGLSMQVGPNVNMSLEPGSQNEASLAINPTNPNNVVAWSNDDSANSGVNEYSSLDGGKTWTRKLIGAGDGLEISACCDTQAVFDSFGNLFAVNIDNIDAFGDAVKVLESSDGGKTFQVVTIATDPNGNLDQPSIAVGDGMVWVSYADFTNNVVMAAGATVTGLGKVGAFSTPQAAPGSGNGDYGNVAVSSNGQVMVSYESPSDGGGPAGIFVNVDPDGLGPRGFDPAIRATTTNVGGFAAIPPQPFRTIDAEGRVYFDNSGGAHNGRAYLVYTDAPSVGSNNTDIFVRTSDNNGMTWTGPVQITDDTSGNSHFLPQMAIDQTTGNIAVAWYDSRNAGPGDLTAQVFATVSTDGGVTWMPNVQVNAGTSNVIPSNSSIDYGDYMRMDFYGGTFRPIWSDNSNSTGNNSDGTLNALDIYTAAVILAPTAGFDVMGTHTYPDESSFTVKVQVTDAGGSSATTTGQVQVLDAPLTPLPAQITASEQANFTGRVAGFVDNNPLGKLSDFTSGSIDWGDGHQSAATITANPTGGFDISGSNMYAEEGTYPISVTIQDKGGSNVTVTSTATITDLPLTGTGASLTSDESKNVSGQVAFFRDAAKNAPLTDFTTGAGGAAVDWGDGSPLTAGVVTQPGGVGKPFAVSGTHVYLKPGPYTVRVTLTDKGGSSATAISNVTVILPRGEIIGRNLFTGQWSLSLSTGASFTTSQPMTWSTGVTWVDVQTGDFNGDGFTDIVGRAKETGDWWVSLANGTGGFTTRRWTTWSTGGNWVDVKVGDFNGDGKDDLAGRDLGSGTWWVAQSTGTSFNTSLRATWSAAASWVDVNVGDFNGDGKADLVARYLQGGSWWAAISSGNSFATSLWTIWSTAVAWVDVNVGDFNGDGKSDIVGRVLQTGAWWAGISSGSNFSTSLWAVWSTAVNWAYVNVGDFNGDGKTDIIALASPYNSWWAGLSSGSGFQTSHWGDFFQMPFQTIGDVQVADFNGDGKSDIAGLWWETRTWVTNLSTGSSASTWNPWGTWGIGYPPTTWVDIHHGDFA